MKLNLHLVLCFSPFSPQLCEVVTPGLVTRCTVGVFDEWPPKAMLGVAVRELHSSELPRTELGPTVKVQPLCCLFCF